jgi:heme-degrading monooxygenase HmoA
MQAVSEILRFTPGRRQEGLARLEWMHGLMQAAPGFSEGLIAKYLGDATRFLVLRYWQDPESMKSFHQAFMRDHAANRPKGLYAIEENTPWDCYYERSAIAESHGSFLVKTHWRVPEPVWPAYEGFQAEVETIALSEGGLTQLRRLKAIDSTDVLNVQRYPGRGDFERYFESSAHARKTEEWPEGIELVSTLCYEVVSSTLA